METNTTSIKEVVRGSEETRIEIPMRLLPCVRSGLIFPGKSRKQ